MAGGTSSPLLVEAFHARSGARSLRLGLTVDVLRGADQGTDDLLAEPAGSLGMAGVTGHPKPAT